MYLNIDQNLSINELNQLPKMIRCFICVLSKTRIMYKSLDNAKMSFTSQLTSVISRYLPYHTRANFNCWILGLRVASDWPNRGEIVFENVFLRYDDRNPVITDLSLKIPAGQKVINNP